MIAETRSLEGVELMLERQPLVPTAGKLALGEPRTPQALLRQVDGHGFADQAKPCDSFPPALGLGM